MSDRTVVGVEAWKCSFALPRPFRLGHKTVDQREYVFVRVTDECGAQGSSFALTRGAPTDLVVTEMIGSAYLGHSYQDPGATRADVAEMVLPHYPEGVVARAMSLIDNALWDLKGQAERQPVSRLLGSRRESAPVLLVEGYPIDNESDEEFVERLFSRTVEGFNFLKVAYGAADPDAFTTRLRKLMARLPEHVEVNVDVAWVWRNPELARPVLDAWRGLRLAWIEDPCANDDLQTLKSIKSMTDIPLGVGDEVTRPSVLIDAVRAGAADVVRFDATCGGGLSGLRSLAQEPELANVTISTHVYPEVHSHGALGVTDRGPIEMFPPNSPWDVTSQFIEPPKLHLVDGVQSVVESDRPGLGMTLDWAHISKNALRRTSVPAAFHGED